MNSKEFKAYVKMCEELLEKNPESVIIAYEDSKRMGFEQLSIDLQEEKPLEKYKRVKEETLAKPGFEFGKLKQAELMARRLSILPRMMRGMKAQFSELSQNDSVSKIASEPTIIWNELKEFVKDNWGIQSIGFTKVPRELVFKDHMVLFQYAVVMIEEMRKDKIAKAPSVPTTMEVMRVYAHLGEAANDTARWLRKKGLKCQPLHPLGGLINTPPLAGKAGLGWLGQNGMVITPLFGPRHRIAVLLLEMPIFEFTDSNEHFWVEGFCENCGICVRRCPTGAIMDAKELYGEEIEGIGRLKRCIDQVKCFSYFEPTGGCSVCLKVCPFSQGKEVYEKIRSKNQ